MSDAQTLSATEFKAHCLEILERLASRELPRLVITKRGRPVAVLTPPDAEADAVQSLYGFMRGSVRIAADADLTAPVNDEPFAAEHGELHG
jgi:prevent-host-death family protein